MHVILLACFFMQTGLLLVLKVFCRDSEKMLVLSNAHEDSDDHPRLSLIAELRELLSMEENLFNFGIRFHILARL